MVGKKKLFIFTFLHFQRSFLMMSSSLKPQLLFHFLLNFLRSCFTTDHCPGTACI